MSQEDEVWYDKILTAFRMHQEREHLDKGFSEIQDEVRYFEESLYYEHMKHSGKLPIMGVNTFLSSKGSPTIIPGEVIRATVKEKKYQISMLNELHKTYHSEADSKLEDLKHAALRYSNIFESLMEAAKYCSLGQITNALFEVGGQYRRNM